MMVLDRLFLRLLSSPEGNDLYPRKEKQQETPKGIVEYSWFLYYFFVGLIPINSEIYIDTIN